MVYPYIPALVLQIPAPSNYFLKSPIASITNILYLAFLKFISYSVLLDPLGTGSTHEITDKKILITDLHFLLSMSGFFQVLLLLNATGD